MCEGVDRLRTAYGYNSGRWRLRRKGNQQLSIMGLLLKRL